MYDVKIDLRISSEQTSTNLGFLNLLHHLLLLNQECTDNAGSDGSGRQNTSVGTSNGLLVLGQSLELVCGKSRDAVELGASIAAGVVTSLLLHVLHGKAAAGCAHQTVLVRASGERVVSPECKPVVGHGSGRAAN